jgi:histidine ammonia-lyase
MADDLGKVLALELYTAAQALDLRLDMINAARKLASGTDAKVFAAKIPGGSAHDASDRDAFLAEVDGLRRELAEGAPVHPGAAVAAAHAAIRRSIPFLDRDRALDGEVAAMVRLVEEGAILAAARYALGAEPR